MRATERHARTRGGDRGARTEPAICASITTSAYVPFWRGWRVLTRGVLYVSPLCDREAFSSGLPNAPSPCVERMLD
jgi:hypothetical protein